MSCKLDLTYLKDDIECDHCVLQWRYHTENGWGTDENGSGLGHGYVELIKSINED